MATPIYTTLNKIREHRPCGLGKNDDGGFRKLLNFLGKVSSDDEPLEFSTILESNGLDDALWCLRSICPEHEKGVRLFAADCAERVLHIFEEECPNDNRPRLAIEAAIKFTRGEISEEELEVAAEAAWVAAWVAAEAARVAAEVAARAAAWAAARVAAEAARASAMAAMAAARAAARVAAEAARAEKEIQAELLINYFG